MTSVAELRPPEPKHLYREEVINDFIRNFLKKYNMSETLNIFQALTRTKQNVGRMAFVI